MTPAVFTSEARQDILKASYWIAKENPVAARAFRAAIKQAAITLGEHPCAGRERPDLVKRPYRFLILTGFPFILAYNPASKPPLVLRVLHGAQDLPERLATL